MTFESIAFMPLLIDVMAVLLMLWILSFSVSFLNEYKFLTKVLKVLKTSFVVPCSHSAEIVAQCRKTLKPILIHCRIYSLPLYIDSHSTQYLYTLSQVVSQSESSTSTRLESSANQNRARPESAARENTPAPPEKRVVAWEDPSRLWARAERL